ncbi:MAG: TonB-dependent receptor [Pseudoxanthomonas sp.]
MAPLSAAICASLVSLPLAAQETDTEQAQSKPATKLDTVIVTVERREQNLQKYAGTAQVLSQEDLKGLGINNELRNIQVAVPGLNMSNQEGNLEIFIRGVGSANNTELGDPGAAPHVNGNYIPRPRGLGAMFYDIERVEINKGPQGTLRGRNALAGTLNIVTKKPELGGHYGGYFMGEMGNNNQRTGEFALNLPLGDYAALRLAGYHLEKDSTFKNSGDPRLKPAGYQDETAGRLSFLYEPDDKLSVFAMLDMGRELGTGYPGANIYTAVKAGYKPDQIDLRDVVYFGTQGKLDSTNWGFQSNITYNFGPVKLEYNGSYRDVDYVQVNANSYGNNWPGRDTSTLDFDSFSTNYWHTASQAQTQELRLSSADDARFRWTTGGFYFHEKQQVGLFSLVDKGQWYSGSEYSMPIVRGNSWAGFGDGTFDVTDRFRVKGGLRYTKESKYRYGIGGNWGIGNVGDVRLGTYGFEPALFDRPNFDVSGLTTQADWARFLLQGILHYGANDTIAQLIGGLANGEASSAIINSIPTQQRGSSEFNFTDWRIGFEYDLNPDSLLYGTVTTGHKAGGFNDSFDVSLIPETYKPESIVAYELGWKNSFDLWGRRSNFNVSGFYYDYSDQVFQELVAIGYDPDTGEALGSSLVSRNVAKSAIYGVEMESELHFGAGFTLQLVGLFMDSKIKEGVVADARSLDYAALGVDGVTDLDLSGNKLPLVSKYTFNARLQHSFDIGSWGFYWQVLASYRSSYYLTQYNNRDVVYMDSSGQTYVESAFQAGYPDEQKGYVQYNAGLGFTSPDGSWRLEAYGSNLTDEQVSLKEIVGSAGNNIRFINDARAYGVRVRYSF